jgi:hypothetical protein
MRYCKSLSELGEEPTSLTTNDSPMVCRKTRPYKTQTWVALFDDDVGQDFCLHLGTVMGDNDWSNGIAETLTLYFEATQSKVSRG